MTMLQTTRDVAGAAVLLLVIAAGNAASASEYPVGTYGEERTILAFKVPDAALPKLLPEGWQASPTSTGPSKGANLNVVFMKVLTVQDPDRNR